MRYEQKLTVALDFPVIFQSDVFSPENYEIWDSVLNNELPAKAIFYIDENVDQLHPNLRPKIEHWADVSPKISQAMIKTCLPGEKIKNSIAPILEISEDIVQAGLCRHSYVFIVGGGAVLDAVGFAASITHRGIRHIRIPTTVLSQDDSAMGVKNGINYHGKKNMLGAFYAPYAVICDSDFLTTLDDRDWVSGVSEALKVALLKDRPLLDYLFINAEEIPARNVDVMGHIIESSAKIHLDHIATGGDAFEFGSSRPLDFGHWSAHYLENRSNHELRHGEAVAIGIALDLFCCIELELIADSDVELVLEFMKRAELPIWSDLLLEKIDGELSILSGIKEFQEHIGGVLALTMPTGLASFVEISELPTVVVENAVKKLQEFVNG